jgi:hypothetical protein
MIDTFFLKKKEKKEKKKISKQFGQKIKNNKQKT